MPGAPNRPPETAAAPAPPAPVPVTPRYRSLARLGPSRVALLLDLWKGSPSPELVTPFDRAETAFDAGDFDGATNALELLSVRFAEPRWPTLPEPFKLLRVAIPAPMPPHWDPDHALPVPEKESKRARRDASFQLDLVRATAAWASAHQIDLPDASAHADRAASALASAGPDDAFWNEVESVWRSVREKVPMPASAGKAPAAPAAESP